MSIFHYNQKGFIALLLVFSLSLAGCATTEKSSVSRSADDGVSRLVDYAHSLVIAAALEDEGSVHKVSGLNYTAGDIPLAYGITSSLEGELIGILFGFDATDFTDQEVAEIPSLVPLVFALLENGLQSNLPDPALVSTDVLQSSYGDALGAHNYIVGGWMDDNLDLYVQVLVDRVSNPVDGNTTQVQVIVWTNSSSALYIGGFEINDTLMVLLDFLSI